MAHKIILGEVRGLMTVIGDAESDARGHAYIIARCDCGNEKKVRASDWRSNKHLSCGSKCDLTPDETQEFRTLIADDVAARAVLAKDDGKGFGARKTARTLLENTGPKRKRALLQKIAERRTFEKDAKRRAEDESQLATLQADFPAGVEISSENRASSLAALRELHSRIDESLTQSRAYLQERIQEIEHTIADEQRAIEQAAAYEQSRIALAELEQQKKDDAAFEKVEQTIFASVRPVLLTPRLPMPQRLAWAEKWKQKAAEAEESAKRVGEEIHVETGARKSAVCKHIAAVYESLAERMQELHRTRHINPESMKECDWLEFATSQENMVFRTREEQSWLVWATKRFYEHHGYSPSGLPNLPNPTFEPDPPAAPIAYGEGLFDMRGQTLAFRQEQAEKQKAALEKLQIDDPKKYEELTGKNAAQLFEDADRELKQLPLAEQLNAATSSNRKTREWAEIVRILQPVDDKVKAEIYVVERATLDQPHLKAEWFWPWGVIVNRGRDVVYDFRLKRWFLAPEPATPGFGKAKGSLIFRQNPATGLDEYIVSDT